MSRFVDLDSATKRARMEKRIRDYFAGCNAADVEAMAAEFTDDAVHYFPPGLDGPWIGAQAIAANWRRLVLTRGSAWSIERIVIEPETLQAVIEWTHWKTRTDTYLRGDEWYTFDPESGRITEIRAFYAAPADPRPAVILEGFNYHAAAYTMAPPVVRPHPDADYPEDSQQNGSLA